MKNKPIFMLATIIFLMVSGLRAQFDDIYYDPDDDAWVESSTEASTTYDYDDTYYEDEGSDEWEEYDYYYSSRLRRFHRPLIGFDYFDDCYVDPFYYGAGYGPRITVSFGYGYGYRPYWSRYHYRRYGYWGDPWFDPWYDPWYNRGFCGGYGYGRYGWGYRNGYRDGFYDGYHWGRYGYGGYGYGGYGYGGYHYGDRGRTNQSNRDRYYGSRRSGVVKTSGRGPVTNSGIRKKSSRSGKTTTSGKAHTLRIQKSTHINPTLSTGKKGTIRKSHRKASAWKAEPSLTPDKPSRKSSKHIRKSSGTKYQDRSPSKRYRNRRFTSEKRSSERKKFSNPRPKRNFSNRPSSGERKNRSASPRYSSPKHKSKSMHLGRLFRSKAQSSPRTSSGSSWKSSRRTSSHHSSWKSSKRASSHRSSWSNSRNRSSSSNNFSSGRSHSSSHSHSASSSRSHSSGMRRR